MDEVVCFLYFSVNTGGWKSHDARKYKEIQVFSQNDGTIRNPIPVFSLYGEETALRADDFVHIEDIRTRSERYAWRIGSHRHHGLFQTVFLRRGRVHATIDGQPHALKGPCLITVPPSTVHDFHFSPDTDGQVLTTALMLFSGRGDGAERFAGALFAVPRAIALTRTAPAVARICNLLDQIAVEFRDRQAGTSDMLEWLVAAVLLLVARAMSAEQDLGQASSQHAELFNRFRALVEKHYLEHRPAGFYAGTLGVGIGRLNRACRAVADRSAFDFAQDRLLLEARRKLTYIAAPVSILAYELGFEDTAYFWRFFRRHTGLTPNEFRQRSGTNGTS